MNLLRPDRLELLAREYALGTLAGPARRRFERSLRDSPAAHSAVGAWQERLGQLGADLPPMVPRDAVWTNLQRRLFPTPAAPGLWSRLGGLLSGRALGGVLAGALLGVVGLRTQPDLAGLEVQREALPASYVGLLSDAAGQPTVLLSSRRHGRVLTAKLLAPLAIPAGQVAQLWALPKDGGAPFPVGTVPASGNAVIALPESSEKLFFNVTRLGISFEPQPAGAGARPGGDFVVAGPCVKLW